MAGILTVEAGAKARGPLFDGTADAALRQWAEATAARLGDEGAAMLRSWPMDKTGRAHGNFQAALHVINDGPVARIPAPTITGVTWGPWLEGVTRRNESTRFKGYRLFRRTAQALRKRSEQVGDEELAKIMPMIGSA